MVPEVAVFSNDKLMGILQIIGTESPRTGAPARMYGNTYKVYIPKEFLKVGPNTLKLQKLPNTYALQSTNYTYLTIDFDYFGLTGLGQIPSEPIHSRLIWLGSANGTFWADQTTVDNDPLTWEWFGIAHSGNPMRAAFWSNRNGSPQAAKRLEWLEKAKEYHMSPVLDYLSDKLSSRHLPDWVDANGELTAPKKAILDAAFAQWGPYIQYYEISNEPCMNITDAALAAEMALVAYIHKTKPAHVKLAAPGYTYGGKHGLPVDWDIDAANRIALEANCDLSGGHSYGTRFIKPDGSVLMETIDTQGTGDPKRITNGFPKEILITESGTVDDHHIDFKSVGVSPDNLYSSCYDKNLRSSIAYADRILNFSTFGEPTEGTDHLCMLGSRTIDPQSWSAQAFPKSPSSEKKLSIFRRLACAYATHGKPLPYIYLNDDDVKNQLVYFRAVDTSTLPPMPGNGHVPNKILLNFVNFDTNTQHRMHMQVTFPATGIYVGTRFDGSDRYADAKSDVKVDATPHR